ncbi:A-kinase anchor protein 9 isoform X2 [Scleropages formosus]|uniref:A-kinase anchor protein 9 isoform X2 n=1 Tax=Scleropages formosus TaxID=113540 RepID=UPI0010FAB067|nr:A-kinase anchor protein 9 isoform X2 [Scleropages formosus]
MEDEERQKKLEAGKAKLAEYRQKKAQGDGQNKPKKKKKSTRPKEAVHGHDEGEREAALSSGSGADAFGNDVTTSRTLHSGETVRHDQTYTIEPESEVSTTAEDYSSEVNGCHEMTEITKEPSKDLIWEEDLQLPGSHSEHEAQHSQTRLQIMEDELAAKRQDVEELSRQLEEIRAGFGTEGLQQLQDFETAIKQRDGIITQLTTNLQQARKEKDEIMREFLEMTEQSQKLQIQFQQLQAGETLRNTSHSSTAADLLHAKQQIHERDVQMKGYQEQCKDQLLQISKLQNQLREIEMLGKTQEESYALKLKEKDLLVAEQERKIAEEESLIMPLKEKLLNSEKLLKELNGQIALKNQELESCRSELSISKQKERMSSGEIQQLMATVEDLQKRCHKGSQSESDFVQRMELDIQKKMDQLRAELDEMYGQQIVQMKQELRIQHLKEMETLNESHRLELEKLRSQPVRDLDQANILNMKITELQQKLNEAEIWKKKADQELQKASVEKVNLQSQIEDLVQDLRSARDKVEKASQSVSYQEQKLNETGKLHDTISDLQAQLAAAEENTKELEAKHESEVTNYKIKLEMLEREKDAVLDRMAESLESELEKLRTQLIFSHEEELTKQREDLQRENLLNVENLKDDMALKHKKELETLRQSLEVQFQVVNNEKESIATERDTLVHELTLLKNDFNLSLGNTKSDELSVQLKELELEIEELRKEGKEKGTLEKENQELLRLNKNLEKETKEKEDCWHKKRMELESENNVLKETNMAMRKEMESLNMLEESYRKIESLTIENEHLKKQLITVTQEIERQRNTFSFAEKNFEVNYQELKDEYTCLVNVKAELEEKVLKVTMDYEAKVNNLQMQICNLQEGKQSSRGPYEVERRTDRTEEDFIDGVELIEKDKTELMEKLEIVQREKNGLLLRLSEVSERLTLKENQVELLEGELRVVRENNQQIAARNERLIRERGKPVEAVSQQQECVESSAAPAACTAPGGVRHSAGGHYDSIALAEEKEAATLQSSLQSAMEARSSVRQQQHSTAISEALQTPTEPPRGTPVEETPVVSAWPSDREQLTQQLQTAGEKQLVEQGAHRHSLHMELEEKEKALIAAEQEILALKERLKMLHVPQSEDARSAVKHSEEIATINQDEFRLQMEAQHISLSQIFAAQLELQRESLQAEKEAALRSLERDLSTAHSQELQQLQEQHQRELQDLKERSLDSENVPRSLTYQNLIHMISGECNQLFQSFARVLGQESWEQLSYKQVEKPTSSEVCHDVTEIEDKSSGSLRHAANKLYTELQLLKDQIVHEYSRLLELQSALKSDGNKIKVLQMAFDELKHSSEEEVARLRLQIDSFLVQSQSCNDPEIHPKAQSVHLEEVAKLRAELHGRQAQLELQHGQEIERLRAYYQQQAKETEERYTTELVLLQQRLQELTGSEAHGRIPGETYQSGGEKEDSEDIKLEDVDLEEDLGLPTKSMCLTQQLQTLRRALYEKYVQEVSALKEQHRAELQRVLEQQSRQPQDATPTQAQVKSQDPVTLIPSLERQHQEQLQEEIAKVVVQMSVEFAQQTELARITKKARETSLAVQTQDNDCDRAGGDQLHEPLWCVSEEQERLKSLLEEKRAEVISLREQLQQAKDTFSAVDTKDSTLLESRGPLLTAKLGKEALSGVDTGGLQPLEELQQELVRMEQDHQQTLEALRVSHSQQLEEQRDQQLQLKAQLDVLRAQLAQEAEVKHSAGDEEAARRHGEGAQKPAPKMQSRSMQTEMALLKTEDRKDDREGLQGAGLNTETSPHSTQAALSSHDVITTERNLLRRANESLRQVLSDVLKTTAAAEETIGRYVEGLLDASSRGQSPQRLTWQRAAVQPFRPQRVASPDSCQGSEAGTDETSMWSGETETDEGLETSQPLTETLVSGAEIQLENEECLMNISSRLQAAVEKLLVAINKTTSQLEHARVTQTELMRESFRHNEEMGELLRRQEELQEQVTEEAQAREQLALELHRAEGLIDGYTDERVALEAKLRQKEELQLHLQQELQVTCNRLRELEEERQHMQEERELLSRQQDAMKGSAGPRELRLVEAAVDAAPEADLLEETEKLMKEKVEVQRQAEKDSNDLLKQVKDLEADLEEQVTKILEMEQAHQAESTDLRQQVQALEKQLENNRRFLDEQAVDREHERDVFQQEIMKLEQQLKNTQKQQPSSEQRNREVDQLTAQLKEKSDWCNELLLSSEQLQRDVQERNEEIEKLEARVRELEQALLVSSETLQKVEEQSQPTPMQQMEDATLEAQLQTEREALDRKEKEISNLEEQLEQFREELENKSEEVQQLQMQLEIQRKELNTQQEDLEHKSSLLQVMEEKDREIAHLNEQLCKLQQMDTAPDNKVIEEKNELLRDLESQVECLKSEQERLKKNSEHEIDQLNDVIEKLQQELSKIEHKTLEESLLDTEDLTSHATEVSLTKEEFDEMKQKMDQTTQELDTLKANHISLLERYRGLQQETSKENERSLLEELQEALQEKTAAAVVMQAEIQALEESASFRLANLNERVVELEACLQEKDSELNFCKVRVEQTQVEAEVLQLKISELQDKLRDKMAALQVSQAQLGAMQQQSQVSTKESHSQTSEPLSTDRVDKANPAAEQLPSPVISTKSLESRGMPVTKVVLLMEKLKELEDSLSEIQKDQELQKQLLSSSEEEVVEYEKMLGVLMNLINGMTIKPTSQKAPVPTRLSDGLREDDSADVSQLLLELQQVKLEASATKEELSSYKESSHKLQEELQVKELTISKLQEDLQKVSFGVNKEDPRTVSELLHELHEVQQEAAATKEELSSYKEQSEKLQKELQEREMTIEHLKEDLHQFFFFAQASGRVSEEDPAAISELLQELKEVKEEAAATKEELSNYRERSEKLQEELQVRDVSLAELQAELQQVRQALAKSEESSLQKRKKVTKQDPSDKTKSSSTKAKPSLMKKNATCQTDRPSVLNGSFQTEGISFADADVQVDMSPSGPDIEEIINEYAEKIEQMQELHAAEIMDMETRHITESDTLKREVQLLQDECSALKAVIENLHSTEVVSSQLEPPLTSQVRDEYASDSSSDWSHRTGYDHPGLNQELRSTPEGARRDGESAQISADILPDRIKSLLREVHQEGMQVLSLSELPLLEGDESQPAPRGWLKEREALLATIDSLKGLITKVQTHRETQHQAGPPGEIAVDWRADLLRAIQQVFLKERSVLKSTLYTHLEQLDTSDAVIHLNQLERRLSEQDAQHREAISVLQNADRNSLLMEVHQLRAQLQLLQQDHADRASATQLPPEASSTGVGGLPDALERQGQGDVVGIPSSTGHSQDLHALHSDRILLDELKNELAQTKLELETTLKAQHKHLKELEALRNEVAEKAAEIDRVNDSLVNEQKKSRELEWAFEKEKCKSDKKEKGEREELEDMRLVLEEQQSQVTQLNQSLEQQQEVSAQLRHQVDIALVQLSREQSHVAELQVQLESAQARTLELSSALEREREMQAASPRSQPTAGVAEAEASCSHVEEGVRSLEGLLETLQAQLDEKHAQVVQLVGEVERHRLEAVQARQHWEEERRASRQEQEAHLKAQQGEIKQLQVQLDKERHHILQLQQEKVQLEDRVAELQTSIRIAESTDAARTLSSSTQIQPMDLWKTEGQPCDRTRDWVLQQKISDVIMVESMSGHSHDAPVGSSGSADSQHLENIVHRLQLVNAKIRTMMNSASGRVPKEELDSKSLAWLQSNLQTVISLVQRLPAILSVPESTPSGASSNSLTERLLRQNAELTGFVSRLTEEKNDLRNSVMKLEEELRHHRQRCLIAGDRSARRSVDNQDTQDILLSLDRETWSKEKSRLEKALRQAEAEVARLRADLRADALRDAAAPDAENVALKRIYGKYLRAESFRKALIYQKKYLLLLLGGFQECEEATLSLIARMGARPSHMGLESISRRHRAFTRFRSAVRVSIALSRMRFLVRRWQKTTGSGSSSLPAVNKNDVSQLTGNEVRTDSPFLHSGGLEVCGERRGTSRGRTGRESPRSALSTHHRFHTVADPGGVACSHLQNYDPDRALTDYISRLEALQRRLGSVQSGSSSYGQLHFGIRR